MPERLVVVGGDAGGMTRGGAGAPPHRRRRARDRRVRARRLHLVLARAGSRTSSPARSATSRSLIARSPEEHRAQRHRRAAATTRCSRIDLDARTVTVVDLDDGSTERTEPFDQLVIATGASPIRPAAPRHRRRAASTASRRSTTASRCATTSTYPSDDRAVVVGGGYVGLEMAEAMQQRGLSVTVVEAGRQPMSTLDPDMGALVADAIRELGIDLHTDTEVRGVRDRTPTDHVRAVVTGDQHVPGRHRRARPRREAQRRPRARRGHRDRPDAAASRPTAGMATSADGVWAAGDCVETLPSHQRPAGHDRARHPRQQAGPWSSGSTRPAATRGSPASSAPRSRRSATTRSAAPA